MVRFSEVYGEVNYDSRKHLPLDEVTRLTGLERGGLESAVRNYGNGVKVYSDNGTDYMDRLDLGRVYHSLNGRKQTKKKGLKVQRYFTDGKTDPFATAGEYEWRKADIKDDDGKLIFEMNVYAPKSWNENSVKVAASKYFFKPDRKEWGEKVKNWKNPTTIKWDYQEYENSPIQLFSRVSKCIADWGWKLGYFQTKAYKKAFEDELNYLQINQMLAFNSPVYFNAGIWDLYGIPGAISRRFVRDPKTGKVNRFGGGEYIRPQAHACFISGPDDTLESLLYQVIKEGEIFAAGSGIGHDLSNVRAKGERLSGGGKASGPISFFRGYDFWGGIIHSGGKTRRAARMTTMRYWHPDIMEFIRAKPREDHKALTLMKAGYSSGMDGEAYKSVAFQSTNLSVRVDDKFFDLVENGGKVQLRAVKTGEIVGEVPAIDMLKEISYGSWRIGDPALQYETIIQLMNTCKNSGMINSSNPCSEYMHLDDTSCNLNSLNVLKFSDKRGEFDTNSFIRATRIAAISADIFNDAASYPDQTIAKVSPEFRTIGVGYANMGAYLMRRGLAYDSQEARAVAAAITAIMNGEAYRTSAELAKALEPFTHYELNKDCMLEVMQKHRIAVDDIGKREDIYGKNFDIRSVNGLEELVETARKKLDDALSLGTKYGYRNAQATVLAPTGTIYFLMGCDTPSIEPGDALILKKNLAGGGKLILAKEEVVNALNNLGYSESQIKEMSDYLSKSCTLHGALNLKPEHYAVFDTAFTPIPGGRTIHFEGHIKMVAAAQPFISGAQSKTNNMPEWATVKDIYDGYILGHKLGLKALSIFRYNSKPVQVLEFGSGKGFKELKRGEKRELPNPADSSAVHFEIADVPVYMHVDYYEDGTPGNIFFDAYKNGPLQALLEMHGHLAAKNLKSGSPLKAPLEDIIKVWRGQKFEPNGIIRGDPYIKTALSVLDYAANWLNLHILGNIDVVEEELKNKVDKTKLKGFQNGAWQTYRMQKVDQWDYEQVIKHSRLGGFAKSDEGDNGLSLKIDRRWLNTRGMTCMKCGNIMVQTAASCYQCTNCYEPWGGCGL